MFLATSEHLEWHRIVVAGRIQSVRFYRAHSCTGGPPTPSEGPFRREG